MGKRYNLHVEGKMLTEKINAKIISSGIVCILLLLSGCVFAGMISTPILLFLFAIELASIVNCYCIDENIADAYYCFNFIWCIKYFILDFIERRNNEYEI